MADRLPSPTRCLAARVGQAEVSVAVAVICREARFLAVAQPVVALQGSASPAVASALAAEADLAVQVVPNKVAAVCSAAANHLPRSAAARVVVALEVQQAAAGLAAQGQRLAECHPVKGLPIPRSARTQKKTLAVR